MVTHYIDLPNKAFIHDLVDGNLFKLSWHSDCRYADSRDSKDWYEKLEHYKTTGEIDLDWKVKGNQRLLPRQMRVITDLIILESIAEFGFMWVGITSNALVRVAFVREGLNEVLGFSAASMGIQMTLEIISDLGAATWLARRAQLPLWQVLKLRWRDYWCMSIGSMIFMSVAGVVMEYLADQEAVD